MFYQLLLLHVTLPVNVLTYSCVCGRVTGYQQGSTDAFWSIATYVNHFLTRSGRLIILTVCLSHMDGAAALYLENRIGPYLHM